MPKLKETIGEDLIRVLNGIGMAGLCLLLVWGQREQIHVAIDKCLVPLFGFKGNGALSWFFVIVTLALGVLLIVRYGIKGKVVSMRDAFLLLVAVGLYGLFRLWDGYYLFEGYWNCGFAYTDGFAVLALALLLLFVIQRTRLLFDNPEKAQLERFSTDLPIESYDEDMFELRGLVKRIVKFIKQTDVSKHSFSMGIVGSWGEGKSSLMNLIKKELKGEEDYLIIDFCPRASKDINHIQEDFLESLRRVLAPHHSGMHRTIAQYADTINVATGTPELIKWLLSLLRIGVSKDVSASRQALQDAIRDTGKNIVVFVDDLDRLTAKEILEVLKVIDRNGAFAGLYFLTAFDKKYINETLTKKLGASGTGNYSDKYFSVEVRLPAHPSYRLMDLLQELLNEASSKGVLRNLSEEDIKKTLQQNSSVILKRLKTVRDVKRFVNQLIYSFVGVQDDVVFADYLLLELIKFSHPEEFANLHHYEYIQPGILTDASNELWYLEDSLIPREDNGSIVPPSNPPQSYDILTRLFPEPKTYNSWYSDRGNRIYSKSAFEFYFFNYEYTHLTQAQMGRLFEAPLTEACSTINNWSLEEKRDLTSYLLTRDVAAFKDLETLRRYYQLTLYAFGKIGNINYWGVLFGLVRKNDVSDMMRRYSVKTKKDYLSWLQETLMAFLSIEPQTASEFLIQTIKHMIDDLTDGTEMYMLLSDLQNIALQIAHAYLFSIDQSGWDSSLAMYLTQIPQDRDNLVPAAAALLRVSMAKHFERYSNKLVTITTIADKKGLATYHQLFLLTKVFPKPYKFGEMIHFKKYDSAPEIDLIRNLWPLYASNGFAPVIFYVGTDMNALRDSLFADYLSFLNTFKEIGREIVKLEREWNAGQDYSKSQEYIEKLSQLDTQLGDISFNLKMKDDYRNWIQDVIATITDQKQTALMLTTDQLQPGDFVTLSPEPSPERPEAYPNYDVFTVESIISGTQVKLKETPDPFPITDLRAIPIDAQLRDVIYFDPVVLTPSSKSHADYSHFMAHFQRMHDCKGQAYTEHVQKANLHFVHQVQHWLKTTHNQTLKLKHPIA